MRIGIVGAENSHCAHIAKSLNIQRSLPGAQVTHVWGETPEFAAKAAREGQIPNIVDQPPDMIGHIDGVMLDHRHGKDHLSAARPFVEANIPVFVDKPFCTDIEEGIEFVRFARSKNVPITSFSTVPLQQSVRTFYQAAKKLGRLRSLVTAGPCDVISEYGGVFFYGIHQVEMVCNLLPGEPLEVTAVRHGDDAVATVTFRDGPLVTHNLLKEWWAANFTAAAYGDDGAHHTELPWDEDLYIAGIRLFTGMFDSREEPLPPASYLRPIAILQAMDQSLGTGSPAHVQSVPDL